MNIIKIYDTKRKEKVAFETIVENRAKIYVCGPTVYDDAHLGHARSAVAFDLLHRLLKCNGYEVEFIKNFTDIDDKIIARSKASQRSCEDISKEYIKSYLEDMDKMLVLKANHEPKATEYLKKMEDMIEILLSRDIAYKLPNGDIYLDVEKDSLYGSLSKRIEDENSQSRIENDEQKRNRRDFALWKAYKGDDDVGYDSPLGKGRPGWHIECSAMIEQFAYEGDYAIDLHAGGADLIFPHHENEASQTRCAKEQEIAKYWMHNEFVTINGEKMSKSLGNSFFVKDALNIYDGEIIRFYLLSTHYRAPLHFSEEDLLVSKKRLDKIYRLKKRIYGVEKKSEDTGFKDELLDTLGDDLNISKSLATIDEMIAKYNETLDNEPKNKEAKAKINKNIEFITSLLGVGGKDAYEYFQLGISPEQKDEIENLIKRREEAKKIKNFKEADELREELIAKNISIMDTPQGTQWEKI